MIKLKLIEPGFEKYTGELCRAQFVDGESVEGLAPAQADQIASVMRTEAVDCEYISPAEETNIRDRSAPQLEPMKTQSEEEKAAEENSGENDKVVVSKIYTEDELAKIADEKGIQGLREIGDPIGAKDVSISGLIRDILAAQEKAAQE